jgi:hypothetical protein
MHVPSPRPWLKAWWILQLLRAEEAASIVREYRHNEYLDLRTLMAVLVIVHFRFGFYSVDLQRGASSLAATKAAGSH